MGFNNVIIPARSKDKIQKSSMNIIGVNNLRDIINKIF